MRESGATGDIEVVNEREIHLATIRNQHRFKEFCVSMHVAEYNCILTTNDVRITVELITKHIVRQVFFEKFQFTSYQIVEGGMGGMTGAIKIRHLTPITFSYQRRALHSRS